MHTIDESKIDFNDLDNEKEISKKEMDDTLDKIALNRNLGSPMSNTKRKSSLIRGKTSNLCIVFFNFNSSLLLVFLLKIVF